MSFVFPHQQRTVTVPAGQSIIIGNFKGAYLEVLNGKMGQPRAPTYRVLQNTAGELLGPYSVDAQLVIVNGSETNEYVVGVSPVLTSVDGGGNASPFAPGAPTIGTATASGTTVTLPFTAPASPGASAILDYQGLLVDGTTQTVSASPAIWTGKTNGPLVGAVRARNASGYGPYSAQSNAVSPGLGTLFPKLAIAKAAMLAGTKNIVIANATDSKTMGAFASGSNLADNRTRGYPNLLAALLAGRYTTYVNSQMGDAANTSTFGNLSVYNPLIVAPSGGWQTGTSLQWGGRSLIGSGGSSSPLNYTPSAPFDTIELIGTATPGAGNLNASVDGGAALGADFVLNGTLAVVRKVYTCPLGMHTININRVGTTATLLNGIRTYNSQVKGIEMLNIGAGSSTPAQWSLNTAKNDPSYIGVDGFFGVTAPDLTIINNATNAWGTAVTPANYKTQTTALILAAQQTGDVLLTSAAPQNSTVIAQATQDAINTAAQELAASLNIPYLDINLLPFQRSWDYSFAQGWYPSLGVDATGNHPIQAGYQQHAQAIYNYLIAAGL